MSSDRPAAEADAPESDVVSPAEASPGPRTLIARMADAVRAAHRAGVPL
jgi:hypothetical protein